MPILVARASEGLRPHSELRLPRQPAARHSLAALLSIARRHTATPNRTRSIRCQGIEPTLALSSMWWADGGHRENARRPDPAPFSPGPGPGCRMKPLSTIRKRCVLRHGPSLCVLPPNQSLLPASPAALLTAVLRFCQLSDNGCCLLRFAAQLRRTLTLHLLSIEFA